MHARIQIVAIAFAVVVFAVVFELVRRRHLRERYALVWMGAALVLLLFAVWKGLLTTVSTAVGIYYPPTALFVIAFAFLLLLVLHLSAAASRHSDEARVLAQRLALLEERTRHATARTNGDLAGPHAESRADAGEDRSPDRVNT